MARFCGRIFSHSLEISITLVFTAHYARFQGRIEFTRPASNGAPVSRLWKRTAHDISLGHLAYTPRDIASSHNADREDLFGAVGTRYLKRVEVSDSHRFVLDQLLTSWLAHQAQLEQTNRKLRAFARQAAVREREAREVLSTIPYVGPVTIDVVLSELGRIERFGSQKQVCAYAGTRHPWLQPLTPDILPDVSHRRVAQPEGSKRLSAVSNFGVSRGGSRHW